MMNPITVTKSAKQSTTYYIAKAVKLTLIPSFIKLFST